MMKCPTCGVTFSATQRLCPTDGAVLEPLETREDKLIGTILDTKYRLDSFLSRGGMGAVFRGTHVMLGRPVAVKMINPDLVTSPEVVRRFQREARAATQLSHPNVVDVYDLGQTPDGTLYIVMELVSGRSLKEAIRSSGSLEPARIVRILGEMCDGLAQAHRRGIIHRDLKPQNVMLTVDPNGVEIAKIVDFGIAKTFEPDAHTQLTATGSTIGTPYYMSPEQASGAVIDGRSDIYSLGIILYEMLTGEVPFDDPSLPSVLLKHMTETPQPPSLKRPDLSVPPALEAIALRCLAKTPAERFENAEALAVALRRALPAGADDEATFRMGAGAPVGMDDPTFRMSGANTAPSSPPGSGASPAAPTMRGAAAPTPIQQPPLAVTSVVPPPLPAPTVHAATAPGTQPTVAAPVPPPSPAAPHPHPVRRGGSALALAGIMLFAMVALAGGAYYMLVMRQSDAVSSADQTPASPPPQASLAAGVDPPAPTPPPAAAGGGVPVSAQGAPSPERSAASTAAVPPVIERAGQQSTGAAARTAPETRRADDSSRAPGAAQRSNAPPAAASPAAPVAASPAAALPATPRVSFACMGPTEICSLLRSAMQETASRQGLPMVRSGADVELGARVELLEERVDRQFGTTMAVRTYSIDFEAEAPALDEDVPMAPAQTVSADARLGGERFAEAARLAASAAVERVQQYWAKKRQ